MRIFPSHIIIVVLFLSVLSCKKFDENPNGIEWHTLKKRLVGKWHIESIVSYGVDSTFWYSQHECFSDLEFKLGEKEDYKLWGVIILVSPKGPCLSNTWFPSFWGLKNRRDKTLTFHYFFHNFNLRFSTGMDIKKLTDEELIIEDFRLGNECRIKMKKL